MTDQMDYDEEQDIVGTLDVIGKAWIPIRPVTNGRQSLPGVLPTMTTTSDNKVTDHSTLTVSTSRRSLSPSRLTRRTSGLSLLPDVSMQHSKLKARAATAERALIEQNATNGAALHKATERIKALELEREKIRLELEGWKAEAERFESETSNAALVGALEKQVEDEQRKKRRLKEDNKRLNIELRSRREREKWDLAIYDADDRKLMNEMTRLEMKVSQLEGWLAIRELEIEDAKEEAESLADKYDELTESYAELEATVAALRSEAAKAKGNADTAAELKKLRADLTAAHKLSADLQKQLDSRPSPGDSDQLAEEVKELKTKLKAAQSETKAKDKEVAAAKAQAESAQAALDMARRLAKEKKERRTKAASESSAPPSDDMITSSPPRTARPAAAVRKAAAGMGKKARSVSASADEYEDESTATVKPPPPPAATATAVKKTVVAHQKRKVDDVLSDKSNNSSKEGAAGGKTGAKDQPAKKKMRLLGGATRKFEWGAGGVENANVNTLGIPMDLSPIKASSAQPKSSLLAGLLGNAGGKAMSLFG